MHFDGADVVSGAQAMLGFVTDVGDAGDDFAVIVGDDETTTLVGHTAAHHRRVGGVEQGDVGIRQRQVVLVHHHALEVVLGLVNALHIDLALFTLGHLDGIETYHLADGLGNWFVLDMGGYREILQFVVEEVDGIVAGFFSQLAQGIGNRHVTVVAGHALGLC